MKFCTTEQALRFERGNVSLPPGVEYRVLYSDQLGVATYPLHHHAYYEALYFLSGSVRYVIEGEQYQLDAGALLIVPPYHLHQVCPPADAPYERIVLGFDALLPEKLSDGLCDLSACLDTQRPGHTNVFWLESGPREELHTLMHALLRESQREELGKPLAERALLTQLFLLLNRASQNGAFAAALEPPGAKLVRAVAAYLDRHYADPITLETLEKRFFVSRYYLSREFTRLVGCPPHRYLLQKRLANAQRLLRGGTPPQQAAAQCGFDDYTNFYRRFRAAYGVGPQDYRARFGAASRETP